MIKKSFLLRIEPESKEKLQKLAEEERRSINSIILLLIDEKLRRENGRKK